MEQIINTSSPPSSNSSVDSAREVRMERWSGRRFFVVPCPFHVDLPLDMSGCVVAALRDTMASGYRRNLGGVILASDVRGSGAVFIEIEPPPVEDTRVVPIDGELLVRHLPTRPSLRGEVDELVRWSSELGRDVASFYVGFSPGEGPRVFRPTRLFAVLDGHLVEHFEVRTKRQYVVRSHVPT